MMYKENLDILPAMLECSPARMLEQFTIPEAKHFIAIGGFVLFEVLLMALLPSPRCECLPTPGGNIVSFRVNALPAWFITVGAYFALQYAEIMPQTFVHDEFFDLLTVLVIFGDVGSFLFYLKGIFTPSNSDATFRGRFWQDFYLGIELHPKIGPINCKLFTIGRIGMNLWTIVNLGHLQKEYANLGYVTWPMILTNLFAAVYTVDWAWKEIWYIRTIDMCHDRFGFMLCSGPLIFMPTFFCCQPFFLSYRTHEISTPFAIFVGALFFFWYVMFRVCNDQKDLARKTKGKYPMWGYKPKMIAAKYTTGDGKEHSSLLLASHLWGVSRHFNYFTDWAMTFCYSLACGFSNLTPHLYGIYMVCLLAHRAYRDDRKCRIKYGKYWDEYCEICPHIFIPYVI